MDRKRNRSREGAPGNGGVGGNSSSLNRPPTTTGTSREQTNTSNTLHVSQQQQQQHRPQHSSSNYQYQQQRSTTSYAPYQSKNAHHETSSNNTHVVHSSGSTGNVLSYRPSSSSSTYQQHQYQHHQHQGPSLIPHQHHHQHTLHDHHNSHHSHHQLQQQHSGNRRPATGTGVGLGGGGGGGGGGALSSHSKRKRRRTPGRPASPSSGGGGGAGNGGGIGYESTSDSPDDEEGHLQWRRDDVIAERYRIIGEAGTGTFGKVLLCEDLKSTSATTTTTTSSSNSSTSTNNNAIAAITTTTTKREVAIKVVRRIRKYVDSARIEADILKEVMKADPDGVSLVVRAYGAFDWRGHYCMVFEPLGPSLYDLVKANEYRPLPLYCVQSFADQLLRAIAFLHSMTLIHTDLKLENVLLVSRERFVQTEKITSARNGKLSSAPKRPEIRLIDFGGATYDNEHKSSLINTRQYRSPEVILGLGWSMASDVWSLGCILMECYTGELLFQTHDNAEHLALMEKILGPFPPAMLQRALSSSSTTTTSSSSSSSAAAAAAREVRRYFDSSGKQRFPAGAKEDSIRHVRAAKPIAELVNSRDTVFMDLIQAMLRHDPEERITASAALNHRFFTFIRGVVQVPRPKWLPPKVRGSSVASTSSTGAGSGTLLSSSSSSSSALVTSGPSNSASFNSGTSSSSSITSPLAMRSRVHAAAVTTTTASLYNSSSIDRSSVVSLSGQQEILGGISPSRQPPRIPQHHHQQQHHHHPVSTTASTVTISRDGSVASASSTPSGMMRTGSNTGAGGGVGIGTGPPRSGLLAVGSMSKSPGGGVSGGGGGGGAAGEKHPRDIINVSRMIDGRSQYPHHEGEAIVIASDNEEEAEDGKENNRIALEGGRVHPAGRSPGTYIVGHHGAGGSSANSHSGSSSIYAVSEYSLAGGPEKRRASDIDRYDSNFNSSSGVGGGGANGSDSRSRRGSDVRVNATLMGVSSATSTHHHHHAYDEEKRFRDDRYDEDHHQEQDRTSSRNGITRGNSFKDRKYSHEFPEGDRRGTNTTTTTGVIGITTINGRRQRPLEPEYQDEHDIESGRNNYVGYSQQQQQQQQQQQRKRVESEELHHEDNGRATSGNRRRRGENEEGEAIAYDDAARSTQYSSGHHRAVGRRDGGAGDHPHLSTVSSTRRYSGVGIGPAVGAATALQQSDSGVQSASGGLAALALDARGDEVKGEDEEDQDYDDKGRITSHSGSSSFRSSNAGNQFIHPSSSSTLFTTSTGGGAGGERTTSTSSLARLRNPNSVSALSQSSGTTSPPSSPPESNNSTSSLLRLSPAGKYGPNTVAVTIGGRVEPPPVPPQPVAVAVNITTSTTGNVSPQRRGRLAESISKFAGNVAEVLSSGWGNLVASSGAGEPSSSRVSSNTSISSLASIGNSASRNNKSQQEQEQQQDEEGHRYLDGRPRIRARDVDEQEELGSEEGGTGGNGGNGEGSNRRVRGATGAGATPQQQRNVNVPATVSSVLANLSLSHGS